MLDQLDARALGARSARTASTTPRPARSPRSSAQTWFAGPAGRLWAPKLRHLVDAGVVETVPSAGIHGYRVKLPLAVEAFDRWDY